MRFRILIVTLLVTVATALAAFYGPATGQARKNCLASGGTWTSHTQVCSSGRSPHHWKAPDGAVAGGAHGTPHHW